MHSIQDRSGNSQLTKCLPKFALPVQLLPHSYIKESCLTASDVLIFLPAKSEVMSANIKSESLSQLQEWTRINDPQEFTQILRIFRESGLYFTTYSEPDTGARYCLFVNKEGQIQAVDAATVGTCIGLFFPVEGQNGHGSVIYQQFLDRVHGHPEFQDTDLPLYYRDRLLLIADSLTWQQFSKYAGLSSLQANVLRATLLQSNIALYPEFEEKNENGSKQDTLLGFYLGDMSGVPTVLNSPDDSFPPVAGYVVQGWNTPSTIQRAQRFEERLQRLTRRDAPVYPINSPHLKSVLAETEEIADRMIAPTTQSEQENGRESFRDQVQAFLQMHLQPLGIEVINLRKLLQVDEGDKLSHLHRAQELNSIPDLLFVNAVSTETMELMTAPPLSGWKAPAKKDTLPTDATAYGNAVGVILVPDAAPLETRKVAMRVAAKKTSQYLPAAPHSTVKDPIILTVDPSLFSRWEEIGHPFAEPGVVNSLLSQSQKKRYDYGLLVPSNPEQVSLVVNEPGGRSHIGGTQLEVRVNQGGVERVVLIDMGWLFDLVPAWSPLGRQPSYTEGIAPFLKEQMFPLNPRLYRTDLILNSLNAGRLQSAIRSLESGRTRSHVEQVDQFIVMEAYHRLGENGFFNFLSENDLTKATWHDWARRRRVDAIASVLKNAQRVMYQDKPVYDLLALTHAHQDHSVGSAMVRDEVMRGWSPITQGILMSDHRLSSQWYIQDTALRKMRELPKQGSAFPVFEYPHTFFQHGVRQEVAPQIFLTPFEVPHSIPGSMGFLVEVQNRRRKVIASMAYGGDYRDWSFFKNVGQAGGTDFLVFEGTNPPGTTKESASYTEAMVSDNLEWEVAQGNQSGQAVVIELVKNAFERLENIFAIARRQGRTIALSPKIAYRLRALQFATRGQAVLPYIPLGDDQIKIWKPHKQLYRTAESEMFNLYDTVTPEDVARNPQHYIVIRENENLTKLDGIGHQVRLLDSTYGAYTPEAHQFKRYIERFAKDHGWYYRTKGLHATGHKPLYTHDQDPLGQGILANLGKAKGKRAELRALPIHTENRRLVAQAGQSYPQNRDIEFISRVPEHPRSEFVLYQAK